MDKAILSDMRKLRLWHWKQVIINREVANEGCGCLQCSAVKHIHDRIADQHIGYVQTLNNFFESGDTAERDAYKEGLN